MKRFLTALALCCTIVFGCGISASATNANETGGVIKPDYYEVCDGLPYHNMVSHAWGNADVNGSRYISLGCAWQCSGCGLVMVTEGDLTLSTSITVGRWAEAPGYPLGVTEIIYILNPSGYGVCNSHNMSGYRFVNSTY